MDDQSRVPMNETPFARERSLARRVAEREWGHAKKKKRGKLNSNEWM